MPNLEERLRALADKGELTHLSVTPLHKGKEFTGWAASYSPSRGFGHGFGYDKDIVTAILIAIDDWKPTRKVREKPEAPPEPRKKQQPEAEPWE